MTAFAQVAFAFDKKSARSRDADGRMRVRDCVLSTAEINPYRGREIPGWDKLGLRENTIYDLYRDPDELRKAVKSFEGIPLMVKHIPQTASDPRKEYQCGAVHSITFDGKHLRGDLIVTDGYAIDLIEADELSDLSCGYRYTPDMTSGEHGGQRYEGVMRDIEGNHVALVEDGRATAAHVADAALKAITGDANMPFPEKAAPGGPTPSNAEATGNAPPTQQSPAAAAPAPGADPAAIGAALKALAGQIAQLTAMINPAAAETPLVPAPAAAPAATPAAAVPGAQDEDASGGEQVGKPDGQGESSLTGQAEAIAPGMMTGIPESDPGAEGEYPLPKQADQDNNSARGGNTPHQAMDSNTVKSLIVAAVKADRADRARVDEAKRAVRGVLGGDIAMDSASDIYREALMQQGVDVTGVAAGQEKLAWDSYCAVAGHAAGVRKQAAMAMDSNTAISADQQRLMANLSRISVKG